jgi:hypothetical protein
LPARRSRPSSRRSAGDALAVLEKAGDLSLHLEREARERRRLVAQEVEELPLRHHRDERRGRAQVRQVADRIVSPGDADLRLMHPVMRPREEPAEHAELVEHLHRRGVDGVAAEIAEEVGVLLEHPHAHPSAREKQSGHHARRPAADDQDIGGCAGQRRPAIVRECMAKPSPTRCPTHW